MKKLLLVNLLALSGSLAFAQCVTPADATAVVATPSVVCTNSSTTVDLNATSTGNQIAWYTSSTGGTPIGYSNSAANFPVTLSSTTVYYAEAVAGGGTITTTYSYTGSVQTFTVPAGVDTITIEAWGAQGNSNPLGVAGGLGGYATGKLLVNAGDVLSIYVGGGGTTTTVGGYNGGGTGGNAGNPTSYGGGGGGASDIRLNGVALTDRVIVAGGGGGAAGNRVASLGRGNGGGGGAGYYGGGGGAAWPSTSIVLPIGGSQVAGGAGGTSTFTSLNPTNNGTAGVFGIGGNGGLETTSNQAGSQAGSVGAVGGGNNGANGTYAGNFSGQSGAGGSGYTGTLLNASMTNGLRSGNGQIILTYGGSCPSVNRIPVTVTINPLPNVSASASPSANVCDGSSLTLSGTGANTYSWAGPVSVSDNIPFTATTAAAGTYTVTGTDVFGCMNTSTISVGILPGPTLTSSSNVSSVCLGDTATITSSGAVSYYWDPFGGTSQSETVVPTITTTYTVTGTAANGCTAIDSVTINVWSLPVLSIAGNTAICIGSADTLTASGANSYVWSSGGTNAAEVISPSANTTYVVTGTDANGCVASDSVSVTVNALPVILATASSEDVCLGDNDTLTASGANTYSWSSGGTSATEIVGPNATTTYIVTGTDANGCSSSDSITVTVNMPPVVSASSSAPVICAGDSATLSANGASSYVWSTGGTNPTEVVSPSATTTYTVTGTDLNGCTGTDIVTVDVNALPVVSLSIPDASLCTTDYNGLMPLTGGTPAGGTWSGPSVTGSNFSPSSSGTGTFPIVYTYTDANSCTSTATQNIVVSDCVGIQENSTENLVTLYPNPANDQLFISWKIELNVNRLDVTDVTGRVVISQPVNSNLASIRVSELPAGVYNLLVIDENGSVNSYRFVKN